MRNEKNNKQTKNKSYKKLFQIALKIGNLFHQIGYVAL
jgi:hypothetical protein